MPREHSVQTQIEDRTALTKPWLVSHIPKRIHDYTQFASTLKKKKEKEKIEPSKSFGEILEKMCQKCST